MIVRCSSDEKVHLILHIHRLSTNEDVIECMVKYNDTHLFTVRSKRLTTIKAPWVVSTEAAIAAIATIAATRNEREQCSNDLIQIFDQEHILWITES